MLFVYAAGVDFLCGLFVDPWRAHAAALLAAALPWPHLRFLVGSRDSTLFLGSARPPGGHKGCMRLFICCKM